MLYREQLRKLLNSEEFGCPQSEKNVWPHQYCPAFELRSSFLYPAQECYFCKYADFHLGQTVAAEIGVCCYPKIQA